MSKLRNLKLERSYYEIEVYLDDIDINEYSVPDIIASKYTFGKYSIRVNESEGQYPHFHITKDKFRSYIRLDTNMYFDHGDGVFDHLSTKQCKNLNKMLKTVIDRESGITLWRKLCNEWNRTNKSSIQIQNDAIMPDYTKIRSNR